MGNKNHIQNLAGKYFHKIKMLIRLPWFRLCGNNISVTASIESDVILRHSSIGKYVYIGPRATALWADVGNYTCIAGGVSIGGMNHAYRESFSINPLLNPHCSMVKNGRTIIGNDVWIGANCTILQGVCIGDGAIIGGGSLVTKSVPENTIVFGVPAKFYKKRFSEEIWKKIKASEYWNYPPEKVKEVMPKEIFEMVTFES